MKSANLWVGVHLDERNRPLVVATREGEKPADGLLIGTVDDVESLLKQFREQQSAAATAVPEQPSRAAA